MKKLYTLALGALLLNVFHANAQCTVSITPSGNDTVCAFSTPTLTANVVGPSTTLNTTMAAGNNHRGNMFDVTAINTVTITSFDASPMGATTVAIYYKTGTWVGFNNNSAAWTLIGSAAVPGASLPTPVPVPVPVNITIPAGQTYAFYVTSTNTSVSLNYTDGTTVGNVFSSDANIQFREGCGTEYPFSGSPFTSRVWNGVIHYTVAGSPAYLWNTSATTAAITPTVTANTTYSVAVTLAGCPTMNATFDMAVSQPVVNAGTDVTVCAGDAVTLSGSGTVAYTWDNGVYNNVPFTPVSTDEYIVQGTDAYGCSDWDTVQVTVIPLPNVNAPADYAVCMGDTTVLSGSGAVVYNWDNGVTDMVAFVPSASMMYHLIGIDINGCSNLDSTMVTVNPLPVVTTGNDTTVCEGAMVTLMGSGALNYSWSGGITDAVPFAAWTTTTYTVTGTDANGCEGTDMVDVNIYTVNTSVTVLNETITANDTTAVSYQWIDCTSGQTIPGETSYWFTATANGTYAVVINDGTCSDTSACETILSTGIAANHTADVVVYPNPNNGAFTLTTTAVAERVVITDLAGRVIASFAPQQTQLALSLEGQANGVYFVVVTNTDHTNTTVKVVKQ